MAKQWRIHSHDADADPAPWNAPPELPPVVARLLIVPGLADPQPRHATFSSRSSLSLRDPELLPGVAGRGRAYLARRSPPGNGSSSTAITTSTA